MLQTAEKILTPPTSSPSPQTAQTAAANLDVVPRTTARAAPAADTYVAPSTRAHPYPRTPRPQRPRLRAPVQPLRPDRQLHLTRPLVAFDLETTGLDKQRDAIVEWGAVKEWPDGRRAEYNFRIRPAVPVSPTAERIHGISNAALAACPPIEKVAPLIANIVRNCDVAGHNLRAFDMPFLRNELHRVDQSACLRGVRIVDTLHTFRKMVPRGQTENHRLATAYQYYLHKPLDGAHGALADARASLDVLHAQVAVHPALPNTVEELAAIGENKG